MYSVYCICFLGVLLLLEDGGGAIFQDRTTAGAFEMNSLLPTHVRSRATESFGLMVDAFFRRTGEHERRGACARCRGFSRGRAGAQEVGHLILEVNGISMDGRAMLQAFKTDRRMMVDDSVCVFEAVPFVDVFGYESFFEDGEAITSRSEAIASRLEAIPIRFLLLLGWRPSL